MSIELNLLNWKFENLQFCNLRLNAASDSVTAPESC